MQLAFSKSVRSVLRYRNSVIPTLFHRTWAWNQQAVGLLTRRVADAGTAASDLQHALLDMYFPSSKTMHQHIARMSRSSFYKKIKDKGFPILDTESWVWSWSRCTGSQPAVTVSHPPGGRLPLLSARPAVTSPPAEHHRPLAGTKVWTTCPRLLPSVAPSRIWTRDVLSASPTLYQLRHRATFQW